MGEGARGERRVECAGRRKDKEWGCRWGRASVVISTHLIVAEDDRVNNRIVRVHAANALLVSEPILLVHLPVLAVIDARAVLLVAEDDEVDVRLVRLRREGAARVVVALGRRRLRLVLRKRGAKRGCGASDRELRRGNGVWGSDAPHDRQSAASTSGPRRTRTRRAPLPPARPPPQRRSTRSANACVSPPPW